MNRHHPAARRDTRKGSRREAEGLWDWNLTSNRIHFSPGWIALIGCQGHEVGNTPDEWFDRVHADDSDRLAQEIDSLRMDGRDEFDLRYRLRHSDGSYRWMSSSGLVVRDNRGRAVRLTGTQVDVTVEIVTDPLTGLPNRLLLLDRLTQSIERARRYETFHFALLLIELGRPGGPGRTSAAAPADPLLNAAARRLETSLHLPEVVPGLRHHHLVARLKGDRFGVLLDGLKELSDSKEMADRILAEMLHPFALGGQEVRLTASIGIAISATGYASADHALRDAETALHRAQVLGGSHCEVFDTGVLKSAQADLQIEGDFEAALQRGEFELLYQPVVSLHSNQIVGFEALVRWQHPELGTVSPADFIPIAERTGFIVPLGGWILQEACRQLGIWKSSLATAQDVWVSVNLSGVQVLHPGLVEEIEAALREAGVQAGGLALELTEGVAMENPTGVATLLMRLRALGIRICIDDFGTGYSSLAYLRQFPVDTLKIDRSFVRGMELDSDATEIVASLISMAQRLGLHVVAEGVENDEQVTLLQSLRCESAQGYLFAKPLDARAATDLIGAGLPPRLERPRPARAPAVGPAARDAAQPSLFSSRAAWGAALAGGAVTVLLATAGVMDRPAAQSTPASTQTSRTDTAAALQSARGAKKAKDLLSPGVPVQPSSPTPATRPAAGPSAPGTLPATSLTRAEPPVLFAHPRQETRWELPAAAPASADVLHLHRFGNCRGRLLVSADGLEFVPHEGPAEDAFALKYTEFLHTLDADTLTIKSTQRTYRFKADLPEGAIGPELQNLADRMSSFRHR